jgi:class 3 adenylate cyclase
MGLKEFKASITTEIDAITSSSFVHEITKTTFVPTVDDPAITFPNPATKTQKSKLLSTAVLFVDMRGSTGMSMKHNQTQLAPIYSSFVRAMSRCAHHYNGYVRNIIGDRVMVVFDRKDCFLNAVNTAILMNSVVKYVLNPKIELVTVKAGIGIDFGEMLVTKTGVIKQGDENDPNKALVWLGKPANVASKLTDVANKQNGDIRLTIEEMHNYSGQYIWVKKSAEEFIDSFSVSLGVMTHKYPATFTTFIKSSDIPDINPPILITKFFYDNYMKEHSDQTDIKNGFWKEQPIRIPGYGHKIVGADIHFPVIKG